MLTHYSHGVLALLGFVVVVAACDESLPVGATTTTGTVLSNDGAVLQVARARCRRANECNHLGSGQQFVNEAQCIAAYLDEGAGIEVLRTCPNGVNRGRLDQCIATLVEQSCNGDSGPVTAMPDCGSYCG